MTTAESFLDDVEGVTDLPRRDVLLVTALVQANLSDDEETASLAEAEMGDNAERYVDMLLEGATYELVRVLADERIDDRLVSQLVAAIATAVHQQGAEQHLEALLVALIENERSELVSYSEEEILVMAGWCLAGLLTLERGGGGWAETAIRSASAQLESESANPTGLEAEAERTTTHLLDLFAWFGAS